MALVLEAETPTIILFWDSLLPAQNSEQACMNVYINKKYFPVSYKDIHAQAHCAAGYLMRKGIRKGDHIGLIAGPGLRYHVLNLALQFLGAINVTIPKSAKTSDIEALARQYRFKMIFVDEVAEFQAHNQFMNLKAELEIVAIGEDEVENLDPEKIVTYDRIVTLGKAAWREDLELLKAMKAAMSPSDICSLLLFEDGSLKKLNMQQWMAAVDTAKSSLEKVNAKSILNLLDPDRLLQRAYCFAAIQKRVMWWSRCASSEEKLSFSTIKPELMVMYPSSLKVLFEKLPIYLERGDKSKKAIEVAMEVIGKRNAAANEKKKDPILNRLKYKTHNKKLYKRIKSKLGGNLAELVLDRGLIDPSSRTMFEECGIRIHQD